MSDDNKALVKRLFDEVFSTENFDAADEIMADEYLEHAVAPFGREEPGHVHGPTHAREVVEWLRAQFPDFTMTIESIVADDDTVAVGDAPAGRNPPTRTTPNRQLKAAWAIVRPLPALWRTAREPESTGTSSDAELSRFLRQQTSVSSAALDEVAPTDSASTNGSR
jgi:ketosteroid isomerase-like protein